MQFFLIDSYCVVQNDMEEDSGVLWGWMWKGKWFWALGGDVYEEGVD